MGYAKSKGVDHPDSGKSNLISDVVTGCALSVKAILATIQNFLTFKIVSQSNLVGNMVTSIKTMLASSLISKFLDSPFLASLYS